MRSITIDSCSWNTWNVVSVRTRRFANRVYDLVNKNVYRWVLNDRICSMYGSIHFNDSLPFDLFPPLRLFYLPCMLLGSGRVPELLKLQQKSHSLVLAALWLQSFFLAFEVFLPHWHQPGLYCQLQVYLFLLLLCSPYKNDKIWILGQKYIFFSLIHYHNNSLITNML